MAGEPTDGVFKWNISKYKEASVGAYKVSWNKSQIKKQLKIGEQRAYLWRSLDHKQRRPWGPTNSAVK
jgi:hypothetical protein